MCFPTRIFWLLYKDESNGVKKSSAVVLVEIGDETEAERRQLGPNGARP